MSARLSDGALGSLQLVLGVTSPSKRPVRLAFPYCSPVIITRDSPLVVTPHAKLKLH